jgi:hypothetical protein
MGLFSPLQQPSRNDNITIATSSTKISDSRNQDNPRTVITCRNISSNANDIITVNLGNNPAVANNGIVLRQYESFTDADDGQYKCWQGSITAISVTGTASNLSVFER